MSNQSKVVSDRVLEVLDSFPDEERQEALEAISTNGLWEQELEVFDKGITVYYMDEGYWKQYQTYFLWRVYKGQLEYGLYLSHPCGDKEWSEDEREYISAESESLDEDMDKLWNKLYQEAKESEAEYKQWVEDNGKDPMDFYWSISHIWKDTFDADDRFQVSLRAWAVNNQLHNEEPDWVKIKERFPEGFWSSLKVNNKVIEYQLKYHCDRPMSFTVAPLLIPSVGNDFSEETFVGWECLECGERISAEPDEITCRKSGSEDDDDYLEDDDD
jgi:hypothetical protein